MSRDARYSSVRPGPTESLYKSIGRGSHRSALYRLKHCTPGDVRAAHRGLLNYGHSSRRGDLFLNPNPVSPNSTGEMRSKSQHLTESLRDIADVVLAATRGEAESILREQSFDILLSTWNLPGMEESFDLCRFVRIDPRSGERR